MIKKKGLLIIIMICFLTGCNVKENIIINKDLSVNEEVNMSGTKDFFDNRYKMLPINVVKDILTSNERENLLTQNGYKYDISELDKFPSVIATKKYNNIETFTNNTIFKNQYFKTFNTIEENNLITINAKDYIKYEQGDLERYSISNCQINIKVPFKVTKNNADKYDSKTNTFIWYINQNTNDKEIKLTFDKTRIYIYNSNLYIIIGLIIILIIIGIEIILKIKNKYKKVNEI